MNCAEIEILICDYVDGTLSADRRALVERHLAECPACAELARDSAAAVAFIERAAEVGPPPELITRILFDAPWRKNKPSRRRAQRVDALAQPDPASEVRHGSGDDDTFVFHAVRSGRRCGRLRAIGPGTEGHLDGLENRA